MEEMTHMDKHGRMVIPVKWRKKLGMEQGGELVLRLDEHSIILEPKSQRIQKALKEMQEYFASLSEDVSYTVDDFMVDRRKESAHRDAKLLGDNDE